MNACIYIMISSTPVSILTYYLQPRKHNPRTSRFWGWKGWYVKIIENNQYRCPIPNFWVSGGESWHSRYHLTTQLAPRRVGLAGLIWLLGRIVTFPILFNYTTSTPEGRGGRTYLVAGANRDIPDTIYLHN